MLDLVALRNRQTVFEPHVQSGGLFVRLDHVADDSATSGSVRLASAIVKYFRRNTAPASCDHDFETAIDSPRK